MISWFKQLFLFVLCLSCGGGAWAAEPLHVAVSIPPQKYFLEKIGGEHVNVELMIPAGAFPHTYEPRPRQLKSLSECTLYFAIGVEFEKAWLGRFQSVNPGMQVVAMDEGIEKIPMKGRHDHGGDDHNHQTADPDPHIWLSANRAAEIAQNVREALKKANPANAAVYDQNFELFAKEIERLDEDLKELFPPQDSKPVFLVFHPSWGYFAADYGLEQMPVEIEGKSPGPQDLKRLILLARGHKTKTIFVQPQISSRSADTLAKAIDGRIEVIDPLAADWEANLRMAAQKIHEAVKGQYESNQP